MDVAHENKGVTQGNTLKYTILGSPSDIHGTEGMKYGLFVTCGPVIKWASYIPFYMGPFTGRTCLHCDFMNSKPLGFNENKGRYVITTS